MNIYYFHAEVIYEEDGEDIQPRGIVAAPSMEEAIQKIKQDYNTNYFTLFNIAFLHDNDDFTTLDLNDVHRIYKRIAELEKIPDYKF